MVQVCAITNDKTIAPEQIALQRADDNFAQLLEKEKQKTALPFLPINLQSMVNVPSTFNFKLDSSISRINTESRTDDHSRHVAEKTVTHLKDKKASEYHINDNSKGNIPSSTTANAAQIQYSANVIPKVFIGELELNSEFYSTLSSLKNDKMSGLQRIDLNDLVSQIKDKIRIMKMNGKIELSINLNPDDLGSILMNVSSNHGALSITFYANAIAKQALDDTLTELEIMLKEANLKVESLSVQAEGHKRNNNGEYLAELLYNNKES